jgi:hypothetical protein
MAPTHRHALLAGVASALSLGGAEAIKLRETQVDVALPYGRLRLVDEVCDAEKALLDHKFCMPSIQCARDKLDKVRSQMEWAESRWAYDHLVDLECSLQKDVLKKQECLPALKRAEKKLASAEQSLYSAEHFLLFAVPTEHSNYIRTNVCVASSPNRTQFFAMEQAPHDQQIDAVDKVCKAEKAVLALAHCEPEIQTAKDELAQVEAKADAEGPSDENIDEVCEAKKKVMRKKKCLPELQKAKDNLAAAEKDLRTAQNGYLLFAMPKC